MTVYGRFEHVVVFILTVLIGIVVVSATWHLAINVARLVLTGVFDPPPDFLTIPWLYLVGVGVAVLATVLAAGLITLRALRRPAIEELRDL